MGGTQRYNNNNNNIIPCAAASSRYYIVVRIDDPHSRPVNDVIRTPRDLRDARATVRQSSGADGNRRFPKRQTHIKHR